MGKTFRQRVHEARVHVKMLSPIEAKRIVDGGCRAWQEAGYPLTAEA